jgi:hypothetical protein
MERSKEYDAFGPWLYEIDEEHEIPRLFKDCCARDDGYLLLFKAPRNIERRKASPNMDLYDYLVGARETCLQIFRRSSKKVIGQTVDYNEIIAVKDVHALLKGELVLYTYGEPVSIEYNTVSEDIILKLIHIIESRISGAARSFGMESIPAEYDADTEDPVDMLFDNLLGKLKALSPCARFVAYQPEMDIRWTRDMRTRLERKACAPAKLAFVANDRELIVISQELTRKNRRKETLDHAYIYVPYQNIKHADAIPFDEERGVSIMELGAGSQTLCFAFRTGNANVAELCRRLGEMAIA